MKYLFLLSALLVAPNLAKAEIDRKGNGGDICEDRIKIVRDDIKAWISSGSAMGLMLPPATPFLTYSQGMLSAISEAKIECSSDKVFVGATEKTCKNYSTPSRELKIQCNVTRFMQTIDEDQYVLVHHEFGGLANLEKMDGESSDYSISNQISGFLVDRIIKKLNVRPRQGDAVIAPSADLRVPYSDAGTKSKFDNRVYYYQGKKYSIVPISGGLRTHVDGQPNDVVIAPPPGSAMNVNLEPYVISANSKIIIYGDDRMEKIYVFDTQLMSFIYSEDYPKVDLDNINCCWPVQSTRDVKETPSARRLYFASSGMRLSASGKFLVYAADFMNWRILNLQSGKVRAQTLPQTTLGTKSRMPMYVDDRDGRTILMGDEIIGAPESEQNSHKGPDFFKDVDSIKETVHVRLMIFQEGWCHADGSGACAGPAYEYPNGNIVVEEKSALNRYLDPRYALRVFLAADDRTLKLPGNVSGVGPHSPEKPSVFYGHHPYSIRITQGIVIVVFDINTDIEDPPSPPLYKRKVVVIDLLTNLISQQEIVSPLEYFRCDETSSGISRGIWCSPCKPSVELGACDYSHIGAK